MATKKTKKQAGPTRTQIQADLALWEIKHDRLTAVNEGLQDRIERLEHSRRRTHGIAKKVNEWVMAYVLKGEASQVHMKLPFNSEHHQMVREFWSRLISLLNLLVAETQPPPDPPGVFRTHSSFNPGTAGTEESPF